MRPISSVAPRADRVVHLQEAVLESCVGSLAHLLRPTLVSKLLNLVGVKYGKKAAQQIRENHRQKREFSKDDFCNVLKTLKNSWGWDCNNVTPKENGLTFEIGACPMRKHGTHEPFICTIEGGFFAGLAQGLIGAHTVATVLRKGKTPPCTCEIKIFSDKIHKNVTEREEEYVEDLESFLDTKEDHAFQEIAERLTPRERAVLKLLGMGLQDKEIAANLNLSPRTVQNHLANVREKLHVHSRTQLVRLAIQAEET